MTEIKPIKVTYPKFDMNVENPYQDEMDKVILLSVLLALSSTETSFTVERLPKLI